KSGRKCPTLPRTNFDWASSRTNLMGHVPMKNLIEVKWGIFDRFLPDLWLNKNVHFSQNFRVFFSDTPTSKPAKSSPEQKIREKYSKNNRVLFDSKVLFAFLAFLAFLA